MKKLFTIKNKNIYDINTTILVNSHYNYNNDAIELLNNTCEVVSKNNMSDIEDIPFLILEKFNCLTLKDKENLSKIDEIKIAILNGLTTDKKIIVFINVLTYVDNDFKVQLIKYLKKKNKRIINITSEIEESLLLDYLIVVHNNEIIMEGTAKELLNQDKIIKKLGYNLPFIIELSNGLKYYNLIAKTHYEVESLVNDLWK